MTRQLVADSSSIISLAINCMSNVLRELDIELLITDEIYRESISRPSESKRYALEAVRIKKLVDDGVVRIQNPKPGATDEILKVSNSIYRMKKHHIQIIHAGEAAALALMNEVDPDTFLIDERTTRMLIEDPEALAEVLSSRNHRRVTVDRRRLEAFRGMMPEIRVIRSSEIVAVAHERGILGRQLGDNSGSTLMAVLYALKFSGCAISWDEIDEYRKLAGSA